MKHKMTKQCSLEAVVVELVVGAQGWQGPHAHAVRKEDLKMGLSRPNDNNSIAWIHLRCAVDPRPALCQLRPVHAHVVRQPVPGALQRQRARQQDEHHKVGKQSSEPNDLQERNILAWAGSF